MNFRDLCAYLADHVCFQLCLKNHFSNKWHIYIGENTVDRGRYSVDCSHLCNGFLISIKNTY